MSNFGNLNFNAAEVEPAKSFDLLPPGEYLVMLTNSDVGPTKSGNGTKLDLTFEVIDGVHNGRKLWDILNIQNSNPTAQQIGQAQLSALCHATGKIQIGDSSELHDIPVIAVVKIEPDKTGQYSPKNKITGYKPANVPAEYTRAPAVCKPVEITIKTSTDDIKTAPAYQQPAANQTYQAPAATPPWAQK